MTVTNRPTRQQSRSQRTRDQIAVAALAVFASKGYAEASMDDICLAAGCSKGGLYHHFPAKRAVLEVVIERLRAVGGLEPPLESPSAATGLAEWALGRLLVDLWAEAARSPQLQALLTGSWAAADNGSALASVLRVGALIQQMTQTPDVEAGLAAARLGIRQAA